MGRLIPSTLVAFNADSLWEIKGLCARQLVEDRHFLTGITRLGIIVRQDIQMTCFSTVLCGFQSVKPE
jgi:hypothetical protein